MDTVITSRSRPLHTNVVDHSEHMSILPSSPPAHHSMEHAIAYLNPQVDRQMVTRSQKGTVKPNRKYALVADFFITQRILMMH